MSICPHCGGHTPTPRHSEKLRNLFAARVGMPAKVNRRSPDAAHNELATDIAAAEDCIDPRSACTPEGYVKLDLGRVRSQGWGEFWEAVGRAIDAKPEPRRAVGFIEFKPGEEPERFDEFTGPMGGEA